MCLFTVVCLPHTGCCCIDEFDKMGSQHHALLEAMVSGAKNTDEDVILTGLTSDVHEHTSALHHHELVRCPDFRCPNYCVVS